MSDSVADPGLFLRGGGAQGGTILNQAVIDRGGVSAISNKLSFS